MMTLNGKMRKAGSEVPAHVAAIAQAQAESLQRRMAAQAERRAQAETLQPVPSLMVTPQARRKGRNRRRMQ